MSKISRRNFLKTMGASVVAIPGLKLADGLVSPVTPFAEPRIGDFVHYATTCRECPAGCGMVVRHREGRAIKAEGNALHPIGGGRLCARGQSALQGHYDPDRLKKPVTRTRNGAETIVTYKAALRSIGERLKEGGRRITLISSMESGALAEVMKAFCANVGRDSRLLFYEPISYRTLADACGELFGKRVVPRFDLTNCDMILSLGAEFLGTWLSPVELARGFRTARAPSKGTAAATFVFAGPTLTQTAANADSFIPLPPGQLRALGLALVKIILERGLARRDPMMLTRYLAAVPLDAALQASGPHAKRVVALAQRLAEARSAVILPAEDRTLALTAMMLNYLTGSIPSAVNLDEPHALSPALSSAELAEACRDFTRDDIVILHNSNPLFALPGRLALDKAGLIITMGTLEDESAAVADYVLPLCTPLECFGDYEPYDGTLSLLQPTTARLYPQDTMNAGDVLLSLAREAGKPLERQGRIVADFTGWLKEKWADLHHKTANTGSFDDFWRGALARGGSWPQKAQASDAALKVTLPRIPLALEHPADRDKLSLWVTPHIMLFDGRFANRGWLQEAPEPVSGVVWGNFALLHPATAKNLGIARESSIKLVTEHGELTAPARISDDTAPGTVVIMSGFGHSRFGSIADGIGTNAFLLSDIGSHPLRSASTESGGAPPTATFGTDLQTDRDLLRWVDAQAAAERAPGEEGLDLPLAEGYDPKIDIFTPHFHLKYRWAMAIDLQLCIGCGSCAVACYAENSLPVKGKTKVAQGRQMAWLRVPLYRAEDDHSRVGFMPLPCQHCDSAPCEAVCPVYASVHNEEGLNAQVYNRCIGTRYCSNNCPYKVRRFNWSDNTFPKPLDQQLNPEVTARSRGVMEKCTFCIQRIREIQQRARLERREVRDGEIKPACVQTCPTEALVFGNLLDPRSAVHRSFFQDPRRYQLLAELNTKPAVVYLKRIARSKDRI